MKTYYTILILVLLQIGQMYAQVSVNDSLYKILNNVNDDSSKYKIQMQLTEYYIEKNRDSAIYFSNACIDLASRNDKFLDVVSSLTDKGHALMHQQKYSESFTCFMEALKIANDPSFNGKTWEISKYPAGDRERLMILAKVYQNFASMMASSNNNEKSKELLLIAKNIAENNKFFVHLGNINLDLGQKYLEQGIIDTALILERQAMQLLTNAGDIKPLGYCNMLIGRIWLQKKNYDSALYYYRKSIAISTYFENYTNLAGSYTNLTDFYLHVIQEPDSAIFYANARLKIVGLTGVKNLGAIYSDIAEAYKLKKNKDSVIKYQTLSISEKDKAFKTREIALNNLQNSSLVEQEKMMKRKEMEVEAKNRLRIYIIAGGLVLFGLISLILYTNNRKKQKANKLLEATLANLKSTQAQLIQSEKMASLGELTAGIAHEIQNPLNFVNNFSELSNELIEEMQEEMEKGNNDEVKNIVADIRNNLEKINLHGKRADAIVKGMLQHSRTTSGEKQPTDINALADEYLRLAYHGLRAKDKNFNATLKTDFDPAIGKINIIPQDIGRVLLNLINNAFYAVNEKSKEAVNGYEPEVTLRTQRVTDSENSLIRQSPPFGGRVANSIIISVKDNGNGISPKILDKIFQPFFTTKPTGQGTGLGLSLSYDIVKAHGGELRVKTKHIEALPAEALAEAGIEFVIQLPA